MRTFPALSKKQKRVIPKDHFAWVMQVPDAVFDIGSIILAMIMAVCLLLQKQFSLRDGIRQFEAWLSSPGILKLRRLGSIGCMLISIEVTLFFAHWVFEGSWMLRDSRHVVEFSAQFLPVVVIFLCWVAAAERKTAFPLRFSPFFTTLSVMLAVFALASGSRSSFATTAYGLSIVSSFFVMLPCREVVRRIIAAPRMTLVALVGGSAAFNYYWLMEALSDLTRSFTAQTVYALLNILGVEVEYELTKGHSDRNTYTVVSDYFGVEVYAGCNGLEGIFLINFMLSCMFLLDWNMFRKRGLVSIYLSAVGLMFLMNILRISLFFSLGYWAYHPDAWSWMSNFRGTPLDLFHSYEGWFIYLIAFWLLASYLYRKPT